MSGSTPKITDPVGELVVCERHNVSKMPGEVVELFGRRFVSAPTCPACEQERDARDAAHEARKRDDAFRRQQLKAGVPPRFADASFDSFVAETVAQREVLAALRRFEATNGADPANLILVGQLGTGKTFAAIALVNAWLTAGRSAVFATAVGLVRQVRDTYGSHEKESAVVRRFTSAGLLVIDEVGAQAGSPSELAILNDVINGRYEGLKPTVVIGNLTASEFREALGERAMDRLREKGRTLVFDWESRRR